MLVSKRYKHKRHNTHATNTRHKELQRIDLNLRYKIIKQYKHIIISY